MAACEITIELDEPSRARMGNEPIAGTVLVKTEKEIRCTGLTVSTHWQTHGRGNIAQGEVDSKNLFEGTWDPGQTYRYPFTLTTASWPPTYYGNYLNVSHVVRASASIPWSIDAKATAEFTVAANQTPEDLKPESKAGKSSWIGWILGILVLGILMAAVIPLAMIVTPIATIGYAIYWICFKFLPRQITGEISYEVEPLKLAPGETLRGTCKFMPKRSSIINGVTWKLRCAEICVSGSGSNRKTHTHEVLCKENKLMDAGKLQAGQNYQYDLAYHVPAAAPPSMTFTDNRIEWTAELRIDIPRWPDWAKTIPFVVKVSPPGVPGTGTSAVQMATLVEDDDPWLSEVLQQVTQSHHDPERLEVVLDAIKDQKFSIRMDVQGEVEEPYEADIDDEGSWVAAVDQLRHLRVVLFVPKGIELNEIKWANSYQGEVQIFGYESNADRVILRLSPTRSF